MVEPEDAEEYAEFTPMYRAVDRLIAQTGSDSIVEWTSSRPWKWAAESFELARRPRVMYCVQVDNTYQYTVDLLAHDGNDDNRKIVEISGQYLDEFGPEAALRLTQAGYRLASLLDEALGQ